MDRLAEILAALSDFATLPDDELASLRSDLKDALKEAREGVLTAEVKDLMVTASEQIQAIATEQTLRAEIAAELEAAADAAVAAVDALDVDAEGEAETADAGAGDGGADTVTTGGDAGEGDAAGGEGGEAPVAIAAAVETPAARPSRPNVAVKARNQKSVAAVASGPKISASGEVKGVAPGHKFDSIDELGKAMYDRWSTMRTSADGQMHYMGTIDYSDMYSEERTLRSLDPWEVSDQVMREVRRRAEDNTALVASGGVPGPAEPRYSQITYGQASRPLRDALPAFLANRGQIVFNQSPTLADIVLDQSGGAVGTLTSAQDLAGTAKTIQEISAPTATTVTVEAEVLRFSQGNFADRFFPERTRAFLALGQVAYARHNEALRLADIKAGSTKWTDTPAKFGAYRDLKRSFLGVTEEIEDRVRDFGQPLHVLMPEYVPAMLACDLIAQAPGDDAWKITEEAVRADMRSWDPSVTITFMNDSIRGRLATTPTGQSPRTPGFDADVEWCIFPEGTWLYLDGGQLDLGIIRDSATSQLNKFQTFFEQFEAVAQIAPLSFWCTNSLCANGTTQLPIAVNVCSPQGS